MAASGLAAQSAPKFSGTWKLDTAQSTAVGGGNGQRANGGGAGGGLGLGPAPDQLIVTGDASSVTIEEHRGAAVSKLVLPFDGKPVPRVIASGRSSGATATSVTKWDKDRLTTMVTLPAGQNPPVQYEELRYLDLGALIVEIRQVGVPNLRRSVYTRAK